MIKIINYQTGFEAQLREVFYTAIHQSGVQFYNQEQINAWAPAKFDLSSWSNRISKIKPFIATIDDHVVGYADVQSDGYIDHFFVHGDYQSQGVGSALMEVIFKNKRPRYYSHVSLSAKDFFIKQGFNVAQTQQASIGQQKLTNFLMKTS
ncbi:GNAT family N-acetyltransferase [Marinicellulosiphila megalodicopiae]|uniref:GNAT family N-acetyltransferase n=1 Tax=Marinicellulosiphila megalodicopiae TaxID=2724896 RepID=UPI003BB1DB79